GAEAGGQPGEVGQVRHAVGVARRHRDDERVRGQHLGLGRGEAGRDEIGRRRLVRCREQVGGRAVGQLGDERRGAVVDRGLHVDLGVLGREGREQLVEGCLQRGRGVHGQRAPERVVGRVGGGAGRGGRGPCAPGQERGGRERRRGRAPHRGR